MIKFELYNPKNYNCTIRSLSKILNKDCNVVLSELEVLCNDMNYSDYNEIEVFEKYMNINNIFKIDIVENKKISELDFSNGKYIVFCYDKKDFYHLVCIINNVLFDKKEDVFNLYPISIYRLK